MTTLPVAVSSALEALWHGRRRSAQVIAVHAAAVYCITDDGEIWTMVARDGVYQPGAVVLPVSSGSGFMAQFALEDRVTIGDRAVTHAAIALRFGRWWQPTPRLDMRGRQKCATQLCAVAAHLPCGPDDGQDVARAIVAALTANTVDEAFGHAKALVGHGPGMTPYGDDVLAGLLAAAALLGDHDAASSPTAAAVDAFVAEVVAHASQATTAISASLLAYAARGAVAAPVARLIVTCAAGRCRPADLDAVLAIGATSGIGLLTGLCVGAGLAVAETSAQQLTPMQGAER